MRDFLANVLLVLFVAAFVVGFGTLARGCSPKATKAPAVVLTFPVAEGVSLEKCSGAREVLYAVRDGEIIGCQVVCR